MSKMNPAEYFSWLGTAEDAQELYDLGAFLIIDYEQALKRRDEAIELLRELEWSKQDFVAGGVFQSCCPICRGGLKAGGSNFDWEGHREDCKLNNLLGDS